MARSTKRQIEAINFQVEDFNLSMGTCIEIAWSDDMKECSLSNIIEEEDVEQMREELINLGIESSQIKDKSNEELCIRLM